MKIKLKKGKVLPRLICIPGLDKEQYRSLQAGKIVDVSAGKETKLLDGGYCEVVTKVTAAKKGSVNHGDDSTD